MKVYLSDICCTRSGDKGPDSNVGVVFYSKKLYVWAVENLTSNLVEDHFKSIAKGGVKRYELPNIYALNFILKDSLGGGGSDTLINDAQGKTYGQALMYLQVEIPEEILND